MLLTKSIIDTISTRLQDPDNKMFSRAYILSELNLAKDELCSVLHEAYLSDIEVTEDVSSDIDTSGDDTLVLISDLDNDILLSKQNIVKMFLVSDDVEYHSQLLSQDEIRKVNENYFFKNAGDNLHNLYHYVFSGEIVLFRYKENTVPAENKYYVRYYKQPDDMVDNDTDEFSLSAGLVPALILLTCASIWYSDGKDSRASSQQERAYAMISTLNKAIKPTDNAGYRAKEV